MFGDAAAANGGWQRSDAIVTAPNALVQITPPRRTVELKIDGETVSAPEGSTILDVCRQHGHDIPTLCYLETLHPVNACRVCVVEVENSRVLVPSCARKIEPGMVVQTDSPRVRHSRKMVLEFLASSVDLSTTPHAAEWVAELSVSSRAVRAAGAARGRGRAGCRARRSP